MGAVVLRTVAATSAPARDALGQYAEELDVRLSGRVDPAMVTASAAEELSWPHGLFVVATDADLVVASGALRFLDPATAEVKRLWVRPSHRRRGLGARVVSHLEHLARHSGRTHALLDTSASLHEAVSMYEALGYRHVAPYNDNVHAELWFAKQLA